MAISFGQSHGLGDHFYRNARRISDRSVFRLSVERSSGCNLHLYCLFCRNTLNSHFFTVSHWSVKGSALLVDVTDNYARLVFAHSNLSYCLRSGGTWGHFLRAIQLHLVSLRTNSYTNYRSNDVSAFASLLTKIINCFSRHVHFSCARILSLLDALSEKAYWSAIYLDLSLH